MRLAGQSQCHHGAAVECIFECDHSRALGVGARNFDRILNRLCPAVYKHCFLRESTRRDLVHAFSQAHVAFIRSHLHAGMQEAIQLFFYRIHNFMAAVSNIQAANPSGEIEVAVAVDVLEPGIFGFRDINGRAVREAAGHGFGAALREGLGIGTVLQYQPIGASFKLMCTCLVSRYSSMPQGPSSRPNPDCLKPPHGASTYVGCMWLTHTIPARSAFTARMALKISRVQTAAASPYGESSAIFSASFSSSNGMTAATGPKISSRAILSLL